MKALSIIVTTLALGACTTPQQAQPEAAAPPVPEAAGDCGTGAVAGLVDKPFSAALETEAKRRSGARAIRAIRPGMAVTMDFRPDRLNIDIDEKNIVTGFRCG